MAVLCANEHNTVFGSKRSATRTQAIYFLHSTMPSVTFLRLSDVSVICRATYFQFPIQSAFLPCRFAGSTAAYWFTQCRTSYVAEILGRHLACKQRTSQGYDFELILTVKMETRYPVEGYFGSEFRVICNHC